MLENRPIVVITIGYIIGIIVGLYYRISIVLFYIGIYVIYSFIMLLIKIKEKTNKEQINKRLDKKGKFKLVSFKRYFRYVKIIFTKKVVFKIILVSIISNSITLYQNYKYENLYKNLDGEDITVIATVVSNAKEKEYKDVYKIKVRTVYTSDNMDDKSSNKNNSDIQNSSDANINESKNFSNTYLYLNVKESLNIELEYGDIIKIKGEFQLPSERRNYKGFDYGEYLKTLKIYGTINATNVEKLRKYK